MLQPMTIRQPLGICKLAFTGLGLVLAACSSRGAIAPVSAPVQTSLVSGTESIGVIAAIRPVGLGGDQASIAAGVSGVLSALQQPTALPGALNATEFVIQRRDGTAAAMVVSGANAGSGGMPPAASFSVGERVEIIDGAEPELMPAN
jgi:hypothetical protein